MPKSALPDHLKDKLHNDYVWPLCYIPRAWTSFGYRSSGLLKWRQFPILIFGKKCIRWKDENDNEFVRSSCERWRFFNKSNFYGPATLQKLSPWSIQFSWPLHFSFHFPLLWGGTFLYRKGCRWDPNDGYFNVGINDTLLAIIIGLIFGWPWFWLAFFLIPDYIGFTWN